MFMVYNMCHSYIPAFGGFFHAVLILISARIIIISIASCLLPFIGCVSILIDAVHLVLLYNLLLSHLVGFLKKNSVSGMVSSTAPNSVSDGKSETFVQRILGLGCKSDVREVHGKN